MGQVYHRTGTYRGSWVRARLVQVSREGSSCARQPLAAGCVLGRRGVQLAAAGRDEGGQFLVQFLLPPFAVALRLRHDGRGSRPGLARSSSRMLWTTIGSPRKGVKLWWLQGAALDALTGRRGSFPPTPGQAFPSSFLLECGEEGGVSVIDLFEGGQDLWTEGQAVLLRAVNPFRHRCRTVGRSRGAPRGDAAAGADL